MTEEEAYRKEWMSDDQWSCAQLAAEYKYGFHHVSNLRRWGNGVAIDEPMEVASYDFNGLTRLVVLAHDECIRVGINKETRTEHYEGHDYEVTNLVISFHPRNRPVDGDGMSSRHPELEAHIADIRKLRAESASS